MPDLSATQYGLVWSAAAAEWKSDTILYNYDVQLNNELSSKEYEYSEGTVVLYIENVADKLSFIKTKTFTGTDEKDVATRIWRRSL